MRGIDHRRLLRNWVRAGLWIGVWVGACWLWWAGAPAGLADAARTNWTIPAVPPTLLNPNMECADGFVFGANPLGEQDMIPQGWTVIYLSGAPTLASTRLRYVHGCEPSNTVFVERQQGEDSLIVLSQDVDTPPVPGKPFDVVLYQRVDATVGGDYSLSAWMISLCGNKSKPFDCPPENYIVKAVGIDPYGGTDPAAPQVIWETNNLNFVDPSGKRQGWQNLRMGAKAMTGTLTVFLRMTSPFQFHGNMGFIDAVSLVRAPLADLAVLPAEVDWGQKVRVAWFGQESSDVKAMPGSTHVMLYDVQTRPVGKGAWRDLAVGAAGPGELQFAPPCADTAYEFRVRARAEQPEDSGGMWPNHRYPGVWSQPARVQIVAPAKPPVDPEVLPGPRYQYLPAIRRDIVC